MSTSNTPQRVPTISWEGSVDGHLVLLDQTKLPGEIVQTTCQCVEDVSEAIRSLRVRGAPAIGIAAAYGVVLGIQPALKESAERVRTSAAKSSALLASSRPTAVNLSWALQRLAAVLAEQPEDASSAIELAERLLAEAHAIYEEDRRVCRAIGEHGASLLTGVQGVLTHCNAGGLATADYGTALAVIFTAAAQGQALEVFVDETRPLLQGARLTAWELVQRRIPATLICDSVAAQVMREGRVQAVVTGADRIAANGDTANKIGTYSVALAAKAHDIPFYVAAPISTLDLSLSSGEEIPIEERSAEEVTHGFGRRTAPEGIAVYNPAFDVTPAGLIRAIITERGLIEPVNTATVRAIASPA